MWPISRFLFLKHIYIAYNIGTLYIKMIWSERDVMWKSEFLDAWLLKVKCFSVNEVQATPRVSNGLSSFEEASDASDVFWFFISGLLGILQWYQFLFTCFHNKFFSTCFILSDFQYFQVSCVLHFHSLFLVIM